MSEKLMVMCINQGLVLESGNLTIIG